MANSVAEGKCCHGNHYSGAGDAMSGREGELHCERHLYAYFVSVLDPAVSPVMVP